MDARNILNENLDAYFASFWANKGGMNENDFSKIPTNTFNACMIFIYENYVNTLEVLCSDGRKLYTALDFIDLCNWYISKSLECDKISIYGFSLLINRSVNFLYTIKNQSDNVKNSFIFETYNNISNSNNVNTNNIILDNINNAAMDGEKLTLPIIEVVQKLFESLQYSTVSKLNDSTIGLVTNANNNKDIGLMYAKERIQEQAKAKAFISLSELPKLEEL